MKVYTLLSTLVLAVMCATARAEIHTVPYVDVNKFITGDWYQIAHIPLFFEGSSDCACARQRLTASTTAGVVNVLNTCTKSDGSPYSISGYASVDDATNSKLTVSFQGVPFKGSYWIIAIGADYHYAVVTDNGGSALYILSKTPTMSKASYQEAFAQAQKQVDTSNLRLTQQKGCTYPQ